MFIEGGIKMFCPKCGNELRENAEFCDKCGAKAAKVVENTNVSNVSNVMLQNAKKQKKFNRGCLISFLIVAGVALALLLSTLYAAQNEKEYGANSTAIIANIGCTNEQSAVINDIMVRCGIDKVSSIEHDELLDHDGLRGYRMKTKDVNNIIMYIDDAYNNVFSIRYADNDLYANGVVKDNITNYFLTTSEENNYQYRTQEAVKQILLSPDSAKFPSILNWQFIKNGSEVIVGSYVDAKNAFGTMVRHEFQAKYYQSEIESLIFDGNEYLK